MLREKFDLSGWQAVIIFIVLGLVVLAWTLDSFLNPVIRSTDLNMVATMVAKDINPTLYARDTLFSNEALYRFYTPLYRYIIYQTWQFGGYFEAGLAWLAPLVLTTYLMAMFGLLWYVTKSHWIALALTVASAHYHDTMGAGVWGVGGSAELMPRTFFMPVIPLITLIFLKTMAEHPTWLKGAGLGFLLGLFTNLHPVSGLHSLMLLSGALILLHGHRLQGWLTALALGVLALVGAWPVTSNYLQNSGRAVAGAIQFDQFSQIVSNRYSLFFFPGTFRWPLFDMALTRPLLDGLVWFYLGLAFAAFIIYFWGRHRQPTLVRWAFLIGGLISLAYGHMMVLFDTVFLFAVVALYLVYCFWRAGYPRLTQWLLALLGLIVLYAFVGYYLLTYMWQTFEVWPLTSLLIEYARAGRFIYLPLYLLAGQAGVALGQEVKRVWPNHDPFVSLTVALILGLGPSVVRYFGDSLGLIILAVALFVPLMILLVWGYSRVPPPWAASLAVVTCLIILFGPLAPLFTGFLSVPARNLLQADNRAPQPVSNPVDSELYAWTQQNTDVSSLFYGCFGTRTMTYFRRKAERSITHNWKDLAYDVHNRATLLTAYRHFRKLEASCQEFGDLLNTGRDLDADYILVSSEDAAGFLQEACFVNERYAVFTLRTEDCVGK